MTGRKVTSGGRQAPTVASLDQPSPAQGPGGMARTLLAEPAAGPGSGICFEGSSVANASAHSDWTLGLSEKADFQAGPKAAAGPVGTTSKLNPRREHPNRHCPCHGAMVGRGPVPP